MTHIMRQLLPLHYDTGRSWWSGHTPKGKGNRVHFHSEAIPVSSHLKNRCISKWEAIAKRTDLGGWERNITSLGLDLEVPVFTRVLLLLWTKESIHHMGTKSKRGTWPCPESWEAAGQVRIRTPGSVSQTSSTPGTFLISLCYPWNLAQSVSFVLRQSEKKT